MKLAAIDELKKLIKFGLVGGVATLVHFIIASFAFLARPDALMANVAGFAVAFLVSAVGHLYWTFRVETARVVAFFRFLLIATLGFSASNLIVFLGKNLGFVEWLCLAAGILTVPPTTYALSRFWGFKPANVASNFEDRP